MKRVLIILMVTFFALTLVQAGDFKYVGAKKCKMCHKGAKKGEVFEKWQKGLHAGAFEKLKAKGEEKNPKCLECHTTAFDKGGYKVGDANASKFEGVQCESCHGPGSAYKKMSVMKDQKQSIANGMVVPTEEVCKKCHNKNSPTFKGFDYKEYLKKI
ncbi:MAG: cytochrome C554, partial [bacterium]|nr:cytochrome C554 [bacterium]